MPDERSFVTTRRVRAVFGLYAAALFVATHWPNLKIKPIIHRPDLIAHASAFGLWAALLIACGWFGRRLGWRNIALGGLVSLVYAGLDEWSQAIPIVHRYATWDDYGANAVGVAGAVVLTLLFKAVRGR